MVYCAPGTCTNGSVGMGAGAAGGGGATGAGAAASCGTATGWLYVVDITEEDGDEEEDNCEAKGSYVIPKKGGSVSLPEGFGVVD